MAPKDTTSIKVFLYSGCDTCRKAVQYLEERAIPHTSIPIREHPPSRTELQRMLDFYGGDLRKLFNTSGLDYKALHLKEKLPSMTPSEAFELLSANGNLVKRPFLLGRDFGLVGFKPAEWDQYFDH